MSSNTTIEAGHRTHPGQIRERNEDNYAVPPAGLSDEVVAAKGRLYLVADGMGGHKGGQLASRLAVQHISQEYYGDGSPDPQQSLGRAIRMANAAIFRQASTNPELARMGTTVTAVVVRGHDLYVANVGDSRTYLLRGSTAEQLTEDHSYIAQGLREGTISPEQAGTHPYRGVITRALGAQPDVQPDFYHRPLRPGDQVLLCSDGLTNEVDLRQIVTILIQSRTAQAAADRLVEQALQNGGRDNITAVVVGVNGYRPAAPAGGLPGWLLPAAAGFVALALVLAVFAAFYRPAPPGTTAVAQMTPAVSGAVVQGTGTTALQSEALQSPIQSATAPTGSPSVGALCGDGVCEETENADNCPEDCQTSTALPATETAPLIALPTATPSPTPTQPTPTPKPSPTAAPSPTPVYEPPQLLEPAPRANLAGVFTFKWAWPGDLGENLGFVMQMSEHSDRGFETVLDEQYVQDLGGGQYAYATVDMNTVSWLAGKSGTFYWRIVLIEVQEEREITPSEPRAFEFTADPCAACRPCREKCKPRMPNPPACCPVCCPNP